MIVRWTCVEPAKKYWRLEIIQSDGHGKTRGTGGHSGISVLRDARWLPALLSMTNAYGIYEEDL